jgi:hypothetical protein
LPQEILTDFMARASSKVRQYAQSGAAGRAPGKKPRAKQPRSGDISGQRKLAYRQGISSLHEAPTGAVAAGRAWGRRDETGCPRGLNFHGRGPRSNNFL